MSSGYIPLNFLDLRRRMRENGDLSHIQHMLQFGEQIVKGLEGKSKQDFLANRDIRDVSVFCLQNMGTAAVYVSRSLRGQFEFVNWRRIIRIRNKIIRTALEPDYEEIWEILELELPQIKDNLKQVITALQATQ